MKRRVLAAALVATAVAGCGGEPILGSWSSVSCGLLTDLMIPVTGTCETVMTFNGDNTLELTSTSTTPPNAPMFGSCRFIVRVTGTWLTGSPGGPSSLSITAPNPATLEVASCMDTTRNRPAAPNATVRFPAVTGTYRVTGNMLEITSSGGSSSFVRR